MPVSLEQYRQACADTLRCLLMDLRLPLYDLMRYHFGWLDSSGAPAAAYAGKALRPALCLMACEALSGTSRPALPAAAAIELVHNYSLVHDDVQDDDRATLRLIEGQYLDISFEQRSAVSTDEYLEMIRGKTAALIAASLQVGALIGSDDPEMALRFHALGLALGMAFQIRDDILGIWGDSGSTGKPTGSEEELGARAAAQELVARVVTGLVSRSA